MQTSRITISAREGLHVHVETGRTLRARRKLEQVRPDLAAAVSAGRMTLYRAQCVAGLRRRTIAVPVDDLGTAIKLLARHHTRDRIAEVALYPEAPVPHTATINGNGAARH
jgi:hypothetical protein